MKIYLKTKVDQELKEVINGFNESLFLALSPPFPKVNLLRFDGSETGDKVSLELNFILFKQIWTSEIVDHHEKDDLFFFIDEGKELPFPLKKWRHKHIMEKDGSGTNVIDDIEFSTGLYLLDILIYPAMWLQFVYRKPIYKRIFGLN